MLLLDTNIVSYIFKNSPEIQHYLCELSDQKLAISLMTRAELWQWAIKYNWGAPKIAKLNALLTNYETLPIDESLCLMWAKVKIEGESVGRPISDADAWIAATALQYNIPLVTHNAKDFCNITGLTLITHAEN